MCSEFVCLRTAIACANYFRIKFQPLVINTFDGVVVLVVLVGGVGVGVDVGNVGCAPQRCGRKPWCACASVPDRTSLMCVHALTPHTWLGATSLNYIRKWLIPSTTFRIKFKLMTDRNSIGQSHCVCVYGCTCQYS
jgi:hypothetical protein